MWRFIVVFKNLFFINTHFISIHSLSNLLGTQWFCGVLPEVRTHGNKKVRLQIENQNNFLATLQVQPAVN